MGEIHADNIETDWEALAETREWNCECGLAFAEVIDSLHGVGLRSY